jgi:hypothetical protein
MIGNVYNHGMIHTRNQHNQLTKIRTHIRKITFYDVFGFAAVFLGSLFNSLSQRSMVFNVVLGVVMLIKVLLGIPFYNKRTMSSLRIYFIMRYMYNAMIICPTLILLRFFTSTYL